MFSRLRKASTAPVTTTTPLERLKTLLEAHRQEDTHQYLTDACLQRHLRARNDDTDKAYTQVLATLKWRTSFRPTELRNLHAGDLRRAGETGKIFVLPQLDRLGRAVIVMRPGLENSDDARNNVRYLVYCLERAAMLAEAGDGDGAFVVIVDMFSGKMTMSNSPGVAVMRETTAILQGHYPERLGGMVLFDAPAFFYGLFRMVRPFIDTVTREKIVFVKKGTALPDVACLDARAVPREYGGEVDFEFDIDTFLKEG